MPANLHVRLAFLLRGILHQIVIQFYLIFRVQRDHCTAAVQERAETLPSSDFSALLDAGIVSHAAH